jgi:Kelch motif
MAEGARSGRRAGPTRILAALGMSAALVLACQAAPAASPNPSSSFSPSPTAVPSLTPTPVPSGTWQAAGSIPVAGLDTFQAVVLPDGRVLVVGTAVTDALALVPAATLFDPATSTWQGTAPLDLPRYGFALVALQDGRVLATGGLTGQLDHYSVKKLQSYSSTYLFDPRAGRETWTKVGELDTARTGAAVALLPDGRVLVAGGYHRDDIGGIGDRSSGVVLANMGPPPVTGRALATAEVFDPATGRWTPTGSLRYARFDAQAVTLSDGRVLIVGSATDPFYGVAGVPAATSTSAELYDPKTGRFSLTGALPDIDRATFATLGLGEPSRDPSISAAGTLVALPDGDALLIGQDVIAPVGTTQAWVTRSYRFAPLTGRWAGIGPTWATVDAQSETATLPSWPRRGMNAFVATLQDGLVLVAGGYDEHDAVTARAYLYDPASDAWLLAASMPDARIYESEPDMYAALTLPDGSALILGGWGPSQEWTSSALRFVPTP